MHNSLSFPNHLQDKVTAKKTAKKKFNYAPIRKDKKRFKTL